MPEQLGHGLSHDDASDEEDPAKHTKWAMWMEMNESESDADACGNGEKHQEALATGVFVTHVTQMIGRLEPNSYPTSFAKPVEEQGRTVSAAPAATT